jgi:outer membrane lipase/esterase
VVLGDSLSDTGNAGRFCDGPVRVEILARAFGLTIRPAKLGGTNYAVGGARVAGGDHDLAAQADRLRADMGGRLDSEALYVIYAGGNDVIASMAQLRCRWAVAAAARGLAATVVRLAELGAQRFLVPNLPDRRLAPLTTMLPGRLARAARATTIAFNRELRRSLRRISADRTLTITELDVFAEVDAMVADGAGPGLLFCDRLHPAASIHRHIAAVALRAFGVGNGGNS